MFLLQRPATITTGCSSGTTCNEGIDLGNYPQALEKANAAGGAYPGGAGGWNGGPRGSKCANAVIANVR